MRDNAKRIAAGVLDGIAKRIAARVAERYDSGMGTVDYTCDGCGTRVQSFETPAGWSEAGGNRHQCPGCQSGSAALDGITCETCPTSVNYAGEDEFARKVVDAGWTPENEVTGGALCPACSARWLDAEGYLLPDAPVAR